MGRDVHLRGLGAGLHDISTHAPLWGATSSPTTTRTLMLGFQPTRPYGARPLGYGKPYRANGFQPTRPYGARRGSNDKPVPLLVFQPTRPYGARRRLPGYGGNLDLFQPTRPYGARPRTPRRWRSRRYFNPRAPMGRDAPLCCYNTTSNDFNPRAPMGRDWQFMQDSAFFTYSIHFSRCVAPCATSKLSLWACHSARTS